MAGPTASVLFPDRLVSEQLRSAIAAAHRLTAMPAEHTLEDEQTILHCWVDDRPFFVSHGEEYPGEWQGLQCSGFSRVVGWEVRDEAGIAAMCNDAEDHLLLGRLCLMLAERFNGIIQFGGCPSTLPSLQSRAHWSKLLWPSAADEEAAFLRVTADFPGRLYQLPQRDANDVQLETHDLMCDAQFMAAWLRHASFRMVK